MKRILLLMTGLFLVHTAQAQNGESPITYKNLGLQFSTLYHNGDASGAVVPSVSAMHGYSSYLDNPAVMALTGESFYSLGAFGNNRNQSTSYLGNEELDQYGNMAFSNLGMVYKFPTKTGSLVIGGGYNLISNKRSRSYFDAFNATSTVTDAYVSEESDFNSLAYDVYAIEYGDNTQTYYESIFRLGLAPNEYRGITQIGDVTNDISLSEYSLFVATEFQKNLFVGLSAGLISGTSTFTRDFLELDEQNNYDESILFDDGSGNGTDIHAITSFDENVSDIIAFSLRAGLVYQLGNNIRLGVSVVAPTRMKVTEDYFILMQTDFDDGTFTDDETDNFSFDYAVTRPAQLNVGASLLNIGKLNISGAAELIDYRMMRLNLTTYPYLSPLMEAELRENEALFNRDIENDYKLVTNLRAGASYEVNEYFTLRGGYAYYPSATKNFNNERTVISGGFGFFISENTMLDLSAQYSSWNDRSILYSYADPATSNIVDVPYGQSVESLNVMAGIKVFF